MALTYDELYDIQKKRKKKKKEDNAVITTYNNVGNKPTITKLKDDRDIAPVLKTFTPTTTAPTVTTKKTEKKKTETKKKDDDGYFKKSNYFADGSWDKGDLINTIRGSVADLGEWFTKGAVGSGEKMVDKLVMLGTVMSNAQMSQLSNDELAFSSLKNIGKDKKTKEKEAESIVKKYNTAQKDAKKGTAEFVKKDLYDEGEIAKKIISAPFEKRTGINVEESSVFGAKSRSLAESTGNMITTKLIGTILGGGMGTLAMGLSAGGGEVEEALKQGATFEEAMASGMITAGAEMAGSQVFNGVKFGGHTLTEGAIQNVARAVSGKTLQTLTKWGINTVGEGAEEVLSDFMSAVGQKLTYLNEKEFNELFNKQDAWDSFLGGMVLGGVFEGVDVASSKITGTDYVTGLNKTEQKVVDKVVEDRIAQETESGKTLTDKDKKKIRDEVIEDVDKGRISIDTIESILGGETHKAYKEAYDKEQAVLKELQELGNKANPTLNEQQRYKETSALAEELTANKKKIRGQLNNEVFPLIKGSRLAESYNETARHSQVFSDDVEQYENEYAKKTIQNAINYRNDEGHALDNTKASHDFIDLMTKYATERELEVVFTTTKGLAELKKNGNMYNIADPSETNGFVSKKHKKMFINMDTGKNLYSLVGHEVTHTVVDAESVASLNEIVKSYLGEAKYKEIFDKKAETYKKYNYTKEEIEEEIVADFCGEKLLTDYDFVKHLSVNDQNRFKQAWDFVKHLYKMATAGSKEARELEKAKRLFEKAYRESAKAKAEVGTKHSIRKTSKIDYSNQLGMIENGELNGSNSLYIGLPSSQLQNVGFSASPLAMNQSDYRKSRRSSAKNKNYSSHAVPYDFFENMPQHLADAPLLIDNGMKVSVITSYEMPDTKGNNSYVIAGVLKDQSMESDTVNLVKSVYPLDDIVNRITKAAEESRLVYTNKNKAEQMLTTIGIQPAEVSRILNLSRDILPQNSEKSSSNTKHSLSSEQETYFKDSKVRDENGNLKVMYHGTSNGKFTVFDTYGSKYGLFGQGSYFTDNKSVAESYTNKGKGEDKKVYETYLNITNPIDMDAQADVNAWAKALPEADFSNCTTNEDCYRAMEEYFEDEQYSKYEASEIAMDVIQGMGYDGITHIGGGRVNADGTRHQVYIAFEPEQIKNIDNTAPTKDADIRYSLTETDNKYLSAVKNGDTETAQRMVDEVAKKNGYTIKGYHATNSDFTVFDIDKTADANFHGKGIYFTNSTRDVEYNYENYEGPDPWAKIEERAYELADEKYGFSYEDTLTGDAEIIDKLNECYDEAIEEFKSTIHRVTAYLKFDNPLILKKGGKSNYGDLSQYDGIIDEQVYENIGHAGMDENTVHYVVFNPRNIKSADAITYDDNGNVIPLSERFKAENNDIRYSLTEDSEGNKLTEKQSEYFANSKAVDKKGSLKLVYHGTRNADFTVFKRNATYFTDSKEMADSYSPNGEMFEGYVNITKPYEIDATGEKWSRIPIDDDTANFLKEYGASVFKEGGKWRTTPADIVSAIEEAVEDGAMDYDGIIIKNIDDTGSYYKDKDKHLATDYIVFNSNQFKKADNKAPTSDPDIRFSLSENVEETKELMALHNLHSNELMKQLKMGGIAYPSVAVTKPGTLSHEGFGDITLILNKDAIDPKKSKYNKLYSADAYTPTFPNVDYEASSDVANNIADKVKSLYDAIPEDYKRSLTAFRDYTNINERLNSARGEEGLIERYLDDYSFKQLYLADKGEVVPTEVKRTETQISEVLKENYQFVVDKLGAELLESSKPMDSYTPPLTARVQWYEQHGEALKEAFAEYWADDGTMTKEEALEIANSESARYWVREIKAITDYIKTGGITVKEEADISSTNALIDEKINAAEYKEWLANLFSGIEGSSGIRNSKDLFTPSGKRRSFSQLHDPVTIDNVIKAMRKQGQTGQGAFGTGNIQGASVQEFGSVAEMKANSDRLGVMDEAEHKEITQQINDRIFEIAERYSNGKDLMDAQTTIVEAVSKYETREGIARYLKQFDYVYKYTDSIGDDIIELRDYIRSIPTPYFEAKPQRAVSFDEVAAFVIPRDADIKVKQELLNKGYSIAEYDPKIEGDRQRVVNSFEQYKFSLSNASETFGESGNLKVYAKDITTPTDIAPVTENPSATVSKTAQVGTVNEDDYAPITEEQALRNAAADREAFDSLTDADMPPEMDAPIYLADTTSIKEKPLKDISAMGRDILFLTPKERRSLEDVVQNFSTSEVQNEEDLFNEIKKLFGEKTFTERIEEVADIQQVLRGYKIYVSPSIKGDIADYTHFMRKNFGKIIFSKQGLPVDTAYMELSARCPNFFPSDIVNPSDQLQQMSAVANMVKDETLTYELDDDVIREATETITEAVGSYKEKQLMRATEKEGRAILRDELRKDKESQKELTALEKYKKRANARLEAEKQVLKEEFNLRIEELQRDASDEKAFNKGLHNLEIEYKRQVKDLESDAKKKLEEFKIANRRKTKQQEYRAQMEALMGDTSFWKDKKLGISYEVNTLRRNLRDVVRDANGKKDIAKADAIYDELQGKYNHNEAELNRESNRIKQKFAEMKITKAEDRYIQMLGEYRHNPETTLTEDDVKNYLEKHKKHIDEAKVDKVIEDARTLYDDLLVKVNKVLSEQGMKEIPYRKGYFPHFREEKQGFLGKLFNWKTKDNDIPTSIAGLTEMFEPSRSWQSFNKQRTTDETEYSFLKGLDSYVQGSLDWIYHIEDIQKRRAFENHIRYTHSEEGIKEKVDAIFNSDEYDADEMQEQIDLVYREANNPLNNFIQDFHTATNSLAGKKSTLDRAMEQKTNRKIYSVMTNLSNRVSGNMVAGSVSSALTNFIPITQSWVEVSPVNSLRAMGETIVSTIRDDGTINKSDFLTNRLNKSENLYQTTWDKVGKGVGFLMDVIDGFTSQTVWRSKYIQNMSQGMSESEAIKNADIFAANVMADRSRGNQPTLFDSKSPVAKVFTAFQLEVNNQYGYFFKDAPQDIANKSKARLIHGYAVAFFGAYAYNSLYSAMTGRNAAFDPIRIIEELMRDLGFGGDDDEEEEIAPVDVALNLTNNILEEVPFIGGLLGGGRVPISSAMPYGGIMEAFEGTLQDLSEGNYKTLTKEWLNPVYYLALPMGGGQIRKTNQGMAMFSDDHPVKGSYTDSGNLRFPVEDNLKNRIQAGVFGQYANKNARTYFDEDIAPLKEKQIQEYAKADMPIEDYWKYRKGLSKLKTQDEKTAYINGLDITDKQKDVLKSYLYDEEGYKKENPEKYAFLEKEGIGYLGYKELDEDTQSAWSWAFKHQDEYEYYKENGVYPGDYSTYYVPMLDFDDESDEAYQWAFDNPVKASLGGVFDSGVKEYRQYSAELSEIKGDGAKEKKKAYIWSLPIDDGQKMILFRSIYSAKKDKRAYNEKIVNYLNSRDDISYDEMCDILEELDFTIDRDTGDYSW